MWKANYYSSIVANSGQFFVYKWFDFVFFILLPCTPSHMGISEWLTCYLDLVSPDRPLTGSWRSKRGRANVKQGCMERGRGKEGQANKQWNFIWALQSLTLFLSLLLILFRAPAAFPSWFYSRTLESIQNWETMTGSAYICLYYPKQMVHQKVCLKLIMVQ